MGGSYFLRCACYFSGDSDIVHVDADESAKSIVFGNHESVYIIHESLEGGRRVAEAKHHDPWLMKASLGLKCGFVSIGLLDMDVVVSLSYVEFGV